MVSGLKDRYAQLHKQHKISDILILDDYFGCGIDRLDVNPLDPSGIDI